MDFASQSDRAIAFIENLTLTDDFRGTPFALREWQKGIIRRLFATRDDGLLQHRRCLLLLPRKQAKTTLTAGIAGYHILGSGKQGQSAVVAASDRGQAGILFGKVVEMIEADPWLRSRVQVYSAAKRIEVKGKGNSLQVLSSDGRRQHGLNPSLVIIDEFAQQKTSELYDALTSAFGARKEHLTILISTAGNRRDSLLYQELEYARKVRDGVIENPEYLPIIYEAAPEDDWLDESVWFKVMPALGDFCNLDFIRSEFAKAREMPSEESKCRQLYLNQWVASENKFINSEKWAACNELDFPDDLEGRPCWAGLDLSSSSDITAFVLVFPLDDGTFAVKCYCWLPEAVAERDDLKTTANYKRWAEAGLISLTEGDVIDHERIYEDIADICSRHEVKSIRIDPFTGQQTALKLAGLGLTVEFMRQGFLSMHEPTKYLEVLIAKEKLRTGNNAVLNFMAENAVSESDSQGNIKISKRKSKEKVDALISLVMALSGAMTAVPEVEPGILIANLS